MQFRITNLECEACVKLSESALKKIAGVKNATVDLDSGKVDLETEGDITWETIVRTLHAVGKNAEI